MGGAVALTLAAAHPELVEKLVLVAPTVYPSHPSRGGALTRVATIPVLGPLVFKQLYGRALFRNFFRESVYATTEAVPAARIEGLLETFNVPAAREAAYATMMAT